MSFLSIEFCKDQMLVAASKSANRRSQLTDVVEIPLKPDATAEEAGELLKELVSSKNWSRHEAIVVVSRSKSELREMTVPPAPDNELPDMVRFKARADFASLNDNWLLDYVALNHDENAQRKVLASAIAPQVAKHAKTVVETAGLKLKQLVLRPYATIDLLRKRFSDNEFRLVIDPNSESIDMSVVRGPNIVATRTVRIPTSYDDNGRANQLISEVRRTLASTKRSMSGGKVSEVVLCDDPEKNKLLKGDLTKRLDLPVSFVDPFAESPISLASLAKQSTKPYLYTSVIGSLSQAATGTRPEIDFLNPRRPIEKKANKERYYLYGGIAALAVLLCLIFGWWTLSSQASQIEQLTTDLIKAKAENEGDGLTPSVDETIAVVGQIDNWKKADINWLDELEEVSKRYLTADDTIVSKFNAAVKRDQPTIEMKGRVSNTEKEKELVAKLTKVEMVDEIEYQRYTIDDSGFGVAADDKDYPMTFSHLMSFTEDEKFLWRMNQRANKFLDAQSNGVTPRDDNGSE